MLGLSKFAIHGMEIAYPVDWQVLIRGKTRIEKGDIILESGHGNRFYVSWGSLQLVSNRFKDLSEHADNNLNNIRRTKNVESIEIVKRSREMINGHDAIFTHARIHLSERMFVRKTRATQEVHSFHIHCKESNRFFVVYKRLDSAIPNDVNLFEIGLFTFKCHLPVITLPNTSYDESLVAKTQVQNQLREP